MILAFKPPFSAPILTGQKIHSIRKDPKGRWKRGRKIHCANYVRTPHQRTFYETQCTGVEPIEIFHHEIKIGDKPPIPDVSVMVGGFPLFGDALEELAYNDGFDSAADFLAFFDKDFKGVIVHWTDYRYEENFGRVVVRFDVSIPQNMERGNAGNFFRCKWVHQALREHIAAFENYLQRWDKFIADGGRPWEDPEPEPNNIVASNGATVVWSTPAPKFRHKNGVVDEKDNG